jgi:hypothetical protein
MQASRQRLEQYITAESGSLLRTLRYYVTRAGLAASSGIGQAAVQLLADKSARLRLLRG